MHTHSPVPLGVARTVLVASASLCLGALWLRRLGRPAFPDGLTLSVFVASAVVAFMALVHSSHGIYARWMRFAEGLQALIVTVLFGACYLLVVPLFFALSWYQDPLRLRRRAQEHSFWVQRAAGSDDLRSFQRMG